VVNGIRDADGNGPNWSGPQARASAGSSGWYSVGQVSELVGVSVRTLHHYDEIGLLVPSGRTPSGYRLYDQADLTRLQHIVVYRRLEFSLEEIGRLLDAAPADVETHLRRQRAAVSTRLDELHALVGALDRALESVMTDRPLSTAEMKELFGEGFSEDFATEAQERWGDTDAWAQSRSRTREYTKADWAAVKAEQDAVNAAFVAALTAGERADGARAMDAAEAHRRHIQDRFYDLGHPMHRALADMYLADPRFTATYERIHPGLAQYVHDAIHANADRAAG
jgi:DNA-binding transcriptional MerR regulator